MKLFGYELSVKRSALPARPSGRDGWGAVVVHEPYTGAWQSNQEITVDSALSHPAVFTCTTLIASDIGKVRLHLSSRDDDGIWSETDSPAFSPVLTRPNRYQTAQKFFEQWVISLLTWGNTFVLKQRDDRNVVVGLFILDPCRVTPMVTPTGDIYYQLDKNDLAGVPDLDPTRDNGPVYAPATEVIHDRINTLFHPLVGLSPIFAAGLPAMQGLAISENSTRFFQKGANPGGLLLAPGKISQETADRASRDWNEKFSGPNSGRVAILSDGLTYQPMGVNAIDSQLVEQLKWSTETICACYHVPVSLVDASIQQPYGQSSEPLLKQYYSQCLQTLMTGIEWSLDYGLALPTPYGTEFDIDDLIWFDTATRTKAASESIRSGAMSPNEARKKYYGLGPVAGGDTPYLQQQMYSLAALAERDADQPFSKPAPVTALPEAEDSPEDDETEDDDEQALAKFVTAMQGEALRVRQVAAKGLHYAG